ncbi:MAG: hypothetical protein HS115_05585 [Spirochaetales bacterium]|nr:hypothetical protein [Spirochaetales bacterium]
MSDFPSPLIAANQSRIAEALAHTLREHAAVAEAYQKQAREMAASDRLKSFIEYTLYHFCLQSGFIHALLKNHSEPLFEFGVPLPDGAIETARISMKQSRKDIELSFEATVPASIESLCSAILSQELIPFISNYYLYAPSLMEDRFIDMYTETWQKIGDLLDSALQQTSVATLSHVRIQDLRPYFTASGEYSSAEMIEEIKRILERNLKQSDVLFELSPFSFVLLSPGVHKEKILERLNRLQFSVRNMPIDFRIFAVTISGHYTVATLIKELEL